MDPGILKLVLVLLCVLAGIALVVLASWFVLRAVGPQKGNVQLQGQVGKQGVRATLKGLTPQLFVILIGGGLIVVGLTQVSVTTHASTVETADDSSRLATWLANARQVAHSDSYKTLTDKILGEDKFRVENVVLHEEATLGRFAAERLGDARFWLLLAAINKDREELQPATFEQLTAETKLPKGMLVEIWRPSRYSSTVRTELIKVAAKDIAEFCDAAMQMVDRRVPYDTTTVGALDVLARRMELSVLHSPIVVSDDLRTPADIALKFYGSKKYWPLVAWSNRQLDKNWSRDTALDPGTALTVFHVVGRQ